MGGRVASLADPLELVGSIVDSRYLIERVVGSGGFGIVYRARHLRFDAPIAVKVLHRAGHLRPAQQELFLERFVTEGKLLFDLSPLHPSFVRALESGVVTTSGGLVLPYLALEWLDGVTLQEEIARQRKLARRLSLIEVLSLFDRVAAGLSIAHARRVAHRDVKPANIFLARQHQQIAAKLLDFGLAKAMDQSLAHADAFGDSQFAHCPFTPAYGAPEQWQRSLGATGTWTDVHALALVCVELLAGRHPFSGGESGQLMAACLDQRVRPTPQTLGVAVSEPVEAVFARALRIDPRERFRDVGEFWASLCAAADFSENKCVPLVLSPDPDQTDAAQSPPATTLPSQRVDGSAPGSHLSETDSHTALTSPPRPTQWPPSRARVVARRLSWLLAGSALLWFGGSAVQKMRQAALVPPVASQDAANATPAPRSIDNEAAPGASAVTAIQPTGRGAARDSAPPHPGPGPKAPARATRPVVRGKPTEAAGSPGTAPAASTSTERALPSSSANPTSADTELRRLMNADPFSLRK